MRKTVLRSIILLLFANCYFFTLPLSAQTIKETSNSLAYTVTIPGTVQADGFYSPDRIIPVYRLAEDDYLQGSIHLKLKANVAHKLKATYQVATDPLIVYLHSIGMLESRPVINEGEVPLIQDQFGLGRIYEVKYSEDIDPYKVCAELVRNPDIEYAFPVYRRYTSAFIPNDVSYSSQWALSKIQAADAWDISKGDTNMVIAIVDGGTDWQHPDLVNNIWRNYREIPGNGKDDDTSGKIDDYMGWDFVGSISQSDIQFGRWEEDNNPRNSLNGHGTHTAGCASAVTNNNRGIAAIGFNCRILPVKCGSDLSGATAGIYRGYDGILYAARMGAKIINCSWGGRGFSLAEEEIIAQVISMGSLIVASSGNDGTNNDITGHYPSDYPGVLCAGGTTSSDQFSASSDYGSVVAAYAPGENILSTWQSNQYSSQTGTSMSSPIIAGLAGLVKTVHPDWSPAQILRQIRVTCDNILSPANQQYRYLYWGRINALKALQYNHTAYPAKVSAGLFAYRLGISGSGAIVNYNPTTVRIYLRNYLNHADTIKISIRKLSDFIDISSSSFEVYNLGTMDSSYIDLTVDLLDNNPWFRGNAELLFTYSAGSFTDIQKINLPIQIPSPNVHTYKGGVSSSIAPQWSGISAPLKDVCWGIGSSPLYGPLYFRTWLNGIAVNRVSTSSGYYTSQLYCIAAFDELRAVAGSGTGYILKTSNSASSWSVINVSSITGFINGLVYLDRQKGLLLGDPKASSWGVASTEDGGLNWSKIDSIPAPLSGETGLVGTTFNRGEQVWFGTSKGRIYFSPDFGKKWNVKTVHNGGTIVKVGFTDSLNGMVAYTESSGTGQTLYLARTTNGGSNWVKRAYNFTQNGLIPLMFYNLPYTRKLLVLFANGYVYATEDLGLTWEPVLSAQAIVYEAGSVFLDSNRARLWEASDYMYALDFEFEQDTILLGVQPAVVGNSSLDVFPNPASSHVNVNFTLSKGEYIQLALIDISGQVIQRVFEGNTPGGFVNFPIDLSGLASGIYVARLTSERGVFTQKIIVKR